MSHLLYTCMCAIHSPQHRKALAKVEGAAELLRCCGQGYPKSMGPSGQFSTKLLHARSTSTGFSMLGAGERRQGNMMRDAICIKFRAGQIRKQLLAQRFSGHFMCVAPGFDSRWVHSFMFLSQLGKTLIWSTPQFYIFLQALCNFYIFFTCRLRISLAARSYYLRYCDLRIETLSHVHMHGRRAFWSKLLTSLRGRSTSGT